MIASLAGRVEAVGADHAVVAVGGVGFLVHASARTLDTLAPGKAARLLVETQVREDAITLHGFATPAERDWFRLLVGVQGVGGRVALQLLGALAPDDLARAVALDDKATLARAPGVGPRLAARIATELKGKLPVFGPGGGGRPGAGAMPSGSGGPSAPATPAAEALSALVNLGYRPIEAERAVAEAQRDLGADLATPALIREALKRAAR